jgi:hypothetical protein
LRGEGAFNGREGRKAEKFWAERFGRMQLVLVLVILIEYSTAEARFSPSDRQDKKEGSRARKWEARK